MKHLVKTLILVALVTFALPGHSGTITPAKITHSEPMNPAEAQKLINRLEEIKAMDPSSLTKKQKREARREVKSIQKKLDSGGVYLSIGAIILIVILLIILL